MAPSYRPRRHRPPLHWRQLGLLTDQVRDQAARAGFPAVTLPDRRIGAGADAWAAFLKVADWTSLENAQVALVRLQRPKKEFPS